jgi:hypothetical protein
MRFFPSYSAWRARRRLRGYIDPKLTRYIFEAPDATFPPPRSCQLDFILILLRDDNLDELPSLVERVTEVVPGSAGCLEHLTGPFIVITFGLSIPNPDAPAQRIQTVSRLEECLAENVKLLHGQALALVGSLTGRGSRFTHFGSAFQNFGAMLQALATLQYGETREFVPRTAARSSPT